MGAKVGNKFEINFNTSAKKRTIEKTYSVKEGSDDLDSTEAYFHDYIITAESSDKYRLHVYTTGNLDFIMLPYAN